MRPIRFACLLTLLVGLAAVAVPATNGIAAASEQGPAWKILVLIYEHTDFSFADGALLRHVVADLTAGETAFAASEAAAFVDRDIPTLDSHRMRPSLEVRYPGTMADLEAFCGWWPAPWRMAAELCDPAFDSVIVIWDSTGTDVNSGQPYNLQNCGGLTLPNDTGQTFSTIRIDGFHPNRFRNTLKHEWGHSILFYHEAAGTAPAPSVDNHRPDAYVHCGTGKGCVLSVDETQDEPIRGSIFNNGSGFAHDYYSGTTALASDPESCIGIARAAWKAAGRSRKGGGRAASAADAAVRTPDSVARSQLRPRHTKRRSATPIFRGRLRGAVMPPACHAGGRGFESADLSAVAREGGSRVAAKADSRTSICITPFAHTCKRKRPDWFRVVRGGRSAMIRQLRLLALILFTTAGMAWPAEVAAQRRATRPAHRGGGAAVAVPRSYPPRSYRPLSHARYYYRYASPRYYAYAPSCTQASDLVLDSAGREQCGARLAMGPATVIRTRITYGYPYPYGYPYG